MKKMLIGLLLTIVSIASQSQIRIGIKGGLNFANQHRQSALGSETSDFHTELQVGAIADIQLTKKLYLQPQLLYSRKGGTHKGIIGGQDGKIKMNYAEVPVNLVYKHTKGVLTYFIGAGPIIGYGFGGEVVQNGQSKDLYSQGAYNFSHLDVGANAVFGVELFNGLFASLNYSHGLRDIDKSDAVKIRNRTTSLSVGYLMNL